MLVRQGQTTETRTLKPRGSFFLQFGQQPPARAEPLRAVGHLMAATPSAQSSGREAPRWLLFHPSPGRRAEHGRSARFQSKLCRTSGGDW
jgi:hypothetical protein